MIDGANAPIFSVNAEGLVKEWNLKMAKLTGFSKKEVLPNPVQAGVGG
jgi:PAS domain-containing protein